MAESACLLVGLGKIAMGYDAGLPDEFIQTHARAFSRHPDFSLLAAVDPDTGKREEFSSQYGVPAFADLDGLPDDFRADIVIVAVPTREHARVVRDVLDRIRPIAILCEKPLGGNLEEARGITNICEKAGTALFVNYIRPADPGARAVKAMIGSGSLGPEIKGAAWYSKGLVHNGSHFVNLAEFWFGPVIGVQVFDEGRHLDGTDAELGFVLRFEHACITFQSAWEESCTFYSMELISQAGRLHYEHGGEKISWQVPETDPVLAGYKRMGQPTEISNDMGRYQWHVAGQLALALAGKPHSLCGADAAIRTQETLDSIIALARRTA